MGQTEEDGRAGRTDGNKEMVVRGRAGVLVQKGEDVGRGKAGGEEDKKTYGRQVCAEVQEFLRVEVVKSYRRQ